MIWKINRAILIAMFALGGLTAPLLLMLALPRQEWEWVAVGVFNVVACPIAAYVTWQDK